jgi:phosphoribosylformimino-5-aminoimidazole carboxamide ribotide isomerase
MIHLIPSISVLKNKIIRLTKGDYDNPKLYKGNPVELATEFHNHGIEQLHLVDLEGAKTGKLVNYNLLETLAGHTSLSINVTGGIKTDGDISKAYEYGATQITAASIAVRLPELFASWIISYGRERVVLGADARNKKVAIYGWQKNTDIDIIDHIGFFYNHGLKYVKITDIDKDGVLEGPSFELFKEVIKEFPGIQVLASGGVRGVDDIKQLNDIGVYAVIFGKAYFENKITLKEIEQFTASA